MLASLNVDLRICVCHCLAVLEASLSRMLILMGFIIFFLPSDAFLAGMRAGFSICSAQCRDAMFAPNGLCLNVYVSL